MARFLVVDDDADLVELIVYILEGRGHRVESVSSGEEALELIPDQRFDFILLDIFLTGIDGLAVCQEIKNNKHLKHIPVGMITSNATNAIRQQAMEKGAEHFFAKPVDVDNFASHLENLLSHDAN